MLIRKDGKLDGDYFKDKVFGVRLWGFRVEWLKVSLEVRVIF